MSLSLQTSDARGLCGTVNGRLQFGGDTGEVADVTNVAQLQRFSRSWIVPADLQTSTVESCRKPLLYPSTSHI